MICFAINKPESFNLYFSHGIEPYIPTNPLKRRYIMSMIKEPLAIENVLRCLPDADYDDVGNGIVKFRNQVLEYRTASIFSFLSSNNGFYSEADCVTDDSVTIFPLGTETPIQELIQNPSCHVKGFPLNGDNINWDTQAMDIDFCVHAAYECCNLGIQFASAPSLMTNAWLESGEIITISEISMQALVDPIVELQPEKVLFVPCCRAELVDDQYFSTCGYYMLDSRNTVIKKVVVLIEFCPTTENGTKNSIAQLVRDYKAIQRSYFMGDMSKDYFQLKYSGVVAAS